jgi:hypothetical protein
MRSESKKAIGCSRCEKFKQIKDNMRHSWQNRCDYSLRSFKYMGPAIVESLNKHMEVGKKALEQIMIKLMFGFINEVGDFTAQGNTTNIILRVSHHPSFLLDLESNVHAEN